MIDTDKSEIPWPSWREMENHTPWGPEWFMLSAQNFQDVPFKRRERYQEGLVGCVIKFHMTDTRWDDNEAMVADANQALIRNAPRLYAEVKRMREDTLKVVTEWFDVYGSDENEWRRLEQALGLPLTPLSWESEE